MKFQIKKITLHYNRSHRTLMVGSLVPNWFERWLLIRQDEACAFIGYGTVWNRYPGLEKVPRFLAKSLAEHELNFKTYHKIFK